MPSVMVALVCALGSALPAAASAKGHVLLVGTYKGIPGQYTTIQQAVDAAHSGDWILVGPGDYKTTTSEAPTGHPEFPAGVLVTKSNLWIRGMSRSKVIVDGTKPGSAACSKAASAQNFGPKYNGGNAGLNGIMVWKANNVWVQNLTACNFLAGSGDAGNEIWWNGGANGGHVDGHGFVGSYLTATSMFFKNEATAAGYGLFTSDWNGGTFDHDYASNFNDSGYYIGACQSICDQILENSRAQYNALGYSGTNSGGPLLIEHNEFDQNEEGFDTNSQNNSDWPSPQDGACPAGVKPQIPGAHSCWIFYKNYVHDNNNPNVPASGSAAAGPVGTGISIEGRNDTVMDNTFANDGAWGVVFQPYPDTGTPPSDAPGCHGGVKNFSFIGISINCLYDDWNDQAIGNKFTNVGFFGNPSNGDIAESTFLGGNQINCYSGNVDTSGTLTTSPASLETTNPACGTTASTGDVNSTFVLQAICDTLVFGPSSPCPAGTKYPRRTKVVMHPLPKLPSMPNPCKGAPANAWCPAPKASAQRA